MTIDQERLDEFIRKFAGDFGAALHAVTVVVGDKLGLYQALAESGPTDPAGLADGHRLRCSPRRGVAQGAVRLRLLRVQRADRNVLAHARAGRRARGSDEPDVHGRQHDRRGGNAKDEEKVRDAFLTGNGLGWHEHHHDLFHGTERLFKPGYVANLASQWIPALDGVDDKLRSGGTVADSGAVTVRRRCCSHRSTPKLPSSASTTTRRRSTSPASERPRRG